MKPPIKIKKEEAEEMYNKLTKKELIKMLISANKIIESGMSSNGNIHRNTNPTIYC